MKWLVAVCAVTFALLTADTALGAGCRYNGKVYPPGTKLGTLTCMPDGRWR